MTDSGRDLTSDVGWGQVVDGLVGANVRDVDLFGFYAIVFAVVLGVLGKRTVVVRS